MSANVIAFASRTSNRTAAALSAVPASDSTMAPGRRDNIVAMAGWRDRARPRRTATGVFFTTDVLATTGYSA